MRFDSLGIKLWSLPSNFRPMVIFLPQHRKTKPFVFGSQAREYRIGSVLIITLKRYTDIGTKILSDVRYERELYIRLNESVKKYTLSGIVHHFGNLYDGHYTSSVKVNGEWYSIDDSSISEDHVTKDDSSAYILFYNSE